MKSVQKIKNILNEIEGKVSFNENLSKLSWFNLGGPAKILFRPKNISDLSIFLKSVDKDDEIKILGAGSNTLIREGGYDGIIIKLGSAFSHISLFNENTLIAGASALDKTVSNFAYENSLSDFATIPVTPSITLSPRHPIGLITHGTPRA